MSTPSSAIPLEFVSKNFPGGVVFTGQQLARVEDLSSAQVHLSAGRAAWQRGQTAQAGAHIRHAVTLAPDDPKIRGVLADVCLSTGDLDGALEHSAVAISLAPGSAEARVPRASALALSGSHDEAFRLIEPFLKLDACPPSAALVMAKLGRRLGLERQAVELVERLARDSRIAPADRACLHFAAAEMYDRAGRYDEAFSHATAAHGAHRRPYDPAQIRRQTDLRLAYYTKHKLRCLPRANHGSRRPIFIVGMPRSGTTLIEQILCSHPDVHGAGEISDLGDIVRDYTTSRSSPYHHYPVCMDLISVLGANLLASQYLSGLSRINATARHVTDKMMSNFLYLGTIATLFPDAHVVHCTRDPLDTCLSCYMTDFAFGHEFAQDQASLADYYIQYRRLMAHWGDTLQLDVIEVGYESVVFGLESQVRRLLKHLELSWDERCVKFHNNPRHAPTASVEQVRERLYDRSAGRWRHYENHLGPLREALSAYVRRPPTHENIA
jgi:Flp pilus assembly protein TadD